MTWPEQKTWTYRIHTPPRRAEIQESCLQWKHPVFKTFQTFLISSASKPPDSGGKYHDFLLGNFKLHLMSGEEEKPEPQGQ